MGGYCLTNWLLLMSKLDGQKLIDLKLILKNLKISPLLFWPNGCLFRVDELILIERKL